MTPKPPYECFVCSARDTWKEGWLWYGNYDKGVEFILCPECAAPHKHEVIEP